MAPRASLEIDSGSGSGSGSALSATNAASNLASMGTSCGIPGEVVSGFAIRRPPKDCERLRSFSMSTLFWEQRGGSTFNIPGYIMSEEDVFGLRVDR